MPRDRDVLIRLETARDFIAAEYARRLTLDEVARQAYWSPYHFHRLYTAVYGQTPQAFLTERRLDEAKRRLVAGEAVSDVCLEIGYESLTSFSAKFRAETGLSPIDFRRRARRFWEIGALWTHKRVPNCFLRSGMSKIR